MRFTLALAHSCAESNSAIRSAITVPSLKVDCPRSSSKVDCPRSFFSFLFYVGGLIKLTGGAVGKVAGTSDAKREAEKRGEEVESQSTALIMIENRR